MTSDKTTSKQKVKTLLQAFAKPDALAKHIDTKNKLRFLKRIYVMGCGRSGTWLLTGILSTFRDVMVFPREVDVEYFGLLACDESALVLKRNVRSFERVELVPASIVILYIVRHPFDVLTSRNPRNDRIYHVGPGRWVGEMTALRWLIESSRPHTKIIRYEDLVRDPNLIQSEIAAFLGLQVETRATEYHMVFRAPPWADLAMHGLRPPDLNSINRWQLDPRAIDYLKSIRLRLSDCLPWTGTTFGYDVNFD